MAHSLPEQLSLVPAWLSASSYLEEHRNVYDLSFTITNPQSMNKADTDTMLVHDKFLREHGSSISTISNTIFPRRLYQTHGHPGFIEHADAVQSRLKQPGAWGTYFQRLTSGKHSDLRPLEVMVAKMHTQLGKSTGAFSRVYEWSAPLYDPTLDCKRCLPQPCMSHLSMKLVDSKLLRMTAVYRSHYYNAKLLGNLMGLRDLQAFFCKEVGLEAGPLTIFSTFATFDSDGWKISEAQKMLQDARAAYADATAAVEVQNI